MVLKNSYRKIKCNMIRSSYHHKSRFQWIYALNHFKNTFLCQRMLHQKIPNVRISEIGQVIFNYCGKGGSIFCQTTSSVNNKS